MGKGYKGWRLGLVCSLSHGDVLVPDSKWRNAPARGDQSTHGDFQRRGRHTVCQYVCRERKLEEGSAVQRKNLDGVIQLELIYKDVFYHTATVWKDMAH